MSDSSLGYLKGFSLESILSMVEMDQESWTLKANSDGRIGFVYCQEGRIVEARVPGCNGVKAAIEILSWESSDVEIMGAHSVPETIQTPLMNILLESNRLKDESKSAKDVEKKQYQEAVSHVIALRPQKGQEQLVQLLRNNRRLHMAWLWYSRTVGTMADIGTALNHARRLAPENRKIKGECKRFTKAQRMVKETKVKRCPFCWTPLSPGAPFCFNCNLDLVITKASAGQQAREKDPFVIDESVKRFSLVLEREKNLYAAYYMAIAHYNMDDLDRTVEFLEDSIALSEGRRFFQNQLELFLALMESKKTVETQEPAREEKEQPHPPGNDRTILVVEDSTTTRKIIAATLNQQGYRVVEAADGLQALSMLIEEQPDLMLLDIILPKMNGYEILSVVKNKDEYRNLPVIMLTGRDGFFNKMKGKMAGATAYITKPFQAENLLRTIEKYF